jgi:SPP1 gp7 family putative phage head morphogenesis protein
MIEHTHTGICTCGEIHTNKAVKLTQDKIQKIDPTRTVTLRNAFVSQMDKRFNGIAYLVQHAIVDQDCFGLNPLKTNLGTLPGNRAFAFSTSQEQLQGFMEWLKEQVNKGIQQLGVGIRQEWTDLYIEDSYKRGVIRARYEMIKAGWQIPSIEASGGIALVIANNPYHIDRMGLLFSRAYNELQGITDAMSQQIGRILAQGIADGDGPRLLAKKLVTTITGRGETLAIRDTLGRFISAKRRAETLARTEIIRSHAEATLQEYKNWGVVGVNVQAEWTTANDGRVCEICASMEGKVFKLSEAQGLIPAHSNCRCAWLPAAPEYDLPSEIK